MHFTALLATAALALTAFASPAGKPHKHDTFELHVVNQCHFSKSVALYQVTKKFKMLQRSPVHNLASGQSTIINAAYHAKSMRLSGHAERGVGGQWGAQALFEFGHSVYNKQDGTAYNLSVMEGSDGDIGIGAYPINAPGDCPAKTCFTWDCPASQGWTSPSQVNSGSPADTVCCHGKQNFKVVFCP